MSALKLCQYIPDGPIPDNRGFAPSLVAENISKYFQEIEVFFIANKETYDSNFEKLPIGDVYRIYVSNLYKRLFQKITKLDPNPLYKQAADIINKVDCDIVCAHKIEFEVNKFKKILKKNVKTIVYAHGLRDFDKKLGIPDRYIAISEYAKRLMIEKGYPKEKISVVYNGVDTDMFGNYTESDLEKIKQAYNINKDSVIISYIGRKHESKGYYVSLQVMKYILQKYKNAFCFVVGSRPKDYINDKHINDIKKLENELSTINRFKELPALPHNKLKDIFNVSDVVLFPTQNDLLGMVALEAMASKAVLIATNNFALPEIVKNGENGFLIDDPTKPDEINELLNKIIPNIEQYEFLKNNARKTILSKFDWKISAKKLENICKGLL